MDDQQEQPSHSGQSLWPSHSQPQMQEVTSASVFATSSPQVAYSTQSSFVTSFTHGQFVDSQFQAPTTTYRIGGQSYQIAHAPGQEVYQPPHSSYERISPVEEYGEPSTTTDTLQQFQHLPTDGATQMISVPVDSQLHRASMGYPMQVLLEDRRQSGSPIVNRGISPVERNVTQSPMSMSQGQENQMVHSSRLIEVVQAQPGHGYSPIASPRLSLMTSNSGMSSLQYATQSDGPSSSDGTGLGQPEPTDQETDQAVSSISMESVVQSSMKQAMRRMESYGHEPDTTQADSSHSYEKYGSPHDSSQGYVPRVMDDGTQDPNSLESAINSTTAPQPSTSSHSSHRSMGHLPYIHGGMQDNDLVSSHGGHLSQTLDTTTGAVGHSHENDISRDLVLVDDAHNSNVGLDGLDFHQFRRDVPIRKSIRLTSTFDAGQKPRARYVPGPYRIDELWCEECQLSYPNECPHHRLTLVFDKVVLSRAWASLPPLLQIFRLGETTELGVFAKRTIPIMTQFGPFVAEVVKGRDSVTNQGFTLQIDNHKDTNETVFLEATDENKCNWMMFVRPAENYSEQNLVCYQHQQDIFFTVTKEIDSKHELKVWYAAHYARNIGRKVLYPTEEDIQELDERENKWPCFECARKFRTSAQLQNHLLEHENEGEAVEGGEEDDSDKEGNMRKKGFSFKSGLLRKKGKLPKPKHDALLNWKKKKSMFYLNKMKRQQIEATNKPMRSLFKKREGEGEGGGNEWVCTHCDLTFDNSNLLNLHTLTHAAEDVGLEEINKLAAGVSVFPTDFSGVIESTSAEVELQLPLQEPEEDVGILSLEPETNLICPVCKLVFLSKRDLIEHASSHGKSKKKEVAASKPFKCEHCWKSFGLQERLTKHLLVHGDDESKPLECQYCHKRFMNNSALSCHLKTHSEKKYFECPICRQGFDQIAALKTHTMTHEVNGIYTCPDCQKEFEDYHLIRKHIRAFHSDKKYPCPECPKVFPRPDKLKLHMLRHSDHREYMCESCGRQFKRKDKLKEHMKRMHTAEREARNINRPMRTGGNSKKFIPKVSPSDYHRFIYKCHMCLLGFKRRGMLVNHLAKRHPDIKVDAVPELNLPILKTQRDYYCAYCEKVYKSSSKRKAHILKNHPGAELPLSSRKKSIILEIPGLPNPTYSQAVGSVTTVPQNCTYCHKQYASKAKLLQHQRKKHSGMVPPAMPRRRTGMIGETVLEVKLDKGQFDESVDIQAADLLTQAMSELTQSLTDNRQSQFAEYQLAPRMAQGSPALVQAAVQPGPSTIELSHLGQALVQAAHYQVAAQQGQITSAASSEVQPGQATVVLTTSVPNSNVQTISVPSSAVTLGVLPRSWTAAAPQFPTFR